MKRKKKREGKKKVKKAKMAMKTTITLQLRNAMPLSPAKYFANERDFISVDLFRDG